MNASMFGKNDESTSASAHTKQKKDICLYKSRNNNNQQITMTNSNSKISMVIPTSQSPFEEPSNRLI